MMLKTVTLTVEGQASVVVAEGPDDHKMSRPVSFMVY
jgi:hypothetical protein